jgi:hypothetical protein
VQRALGGARTVINVGAGSGSYEPQDRYLIAVEPSARMRAQRSTPAVIGAAEDLPFDDDCTDGFIEAYRARPEALLDPEVRAGQSAWSFADPEPVERGLQRLRDALQTGEWDARHGHLRTQPEYVGALRLLEA